MRYINVNEDYVSKILAANNLEESQAITESQEVQAVEEVVEESVEGHVCPLCESELDAPIPEEAMQECVDFILGTINEALEMEGENLSEADDEDEEEEEEKEDEKEDDDDNGDKPEKGKMPPQLKKHMKDKK
mgnify:CR=1 FL=1|tara:strand:+ start:865 stop:1260 length:396 start_codon:yes stop_codon:yes gene_type:complete